MSSSIFARSSCPCADDFSAADSLRYSFSSEAAACNVARSSFLKLPVEPFAIVSLYFLHAAATPSNESFSFLNSPLTAFAPSLTPCGSRLARYVMSVFAIAFQFLSPWLQGVLYHFCQLKFFPSCYPMGILGCPVVSASFCCWLVRRQAAEASSAPNSPCSTGKNAPYIALPHRWA